MKGKKNPKKYPYKGEMLQMAQILALPECTKSRNNIRQHLIAGKSLEQIFAIDVAPKKAKVLKADADKIAKADKIAAERDMVKAIMAVPVNPKYTQQYYMKKTPLGNDGIVEPVRLKQNGWIG